MEVEPHADVLHAVVLSLIAHNCLLQVVASDFGNGAVWPLEGGVGAR